MWTPFWRPTPPTYEWMDRYMEYGRKYTQDACQVTGGYQMEFTAKDAALEESLFTWKGDYTMLQSQKALQFDTNMVFNTSASSQGDVSLDMNASIDMDAAMRMDLETGKLYFQSKALSGMLGAEKLDSWYLLDLKNTMTACTAPATTRICWPWPIRRTTAASARLWRCCSGKLLPSARI